VSSPNEQVQTLLRLLLATEPTEIDCDGFLKRIAGVVDAMGDDLDPPPELAAVSKHLEVCPECREEFDALLRALDS